MLGAMLNLFKFRTIKFLQEMHENSNRRFDDLRAQIAILAQDQVGVRAEMRALRSDVRAIQAELQRVSLSFRDLAIIPDHLDKRLDAIEREIGLDNPKH